MLEQHVKRSILERFICDRCPSTRSQLLMMLLQVTAVFALTSSVIYAVQIAPKILNVDYQIHSNNDLKELPQVLVKGARRFKFDPHYVKSSAACGDRKSCLLLNHDRPTTEVSNYNTSTELLNYLKSDEFATITEGERVTVALCFKSAPDKCQKTAAFEDWLALVDDFYLQAQSAPKQVEFILDGDAKPAGCLVGRWEKWNSVWINSPAEPFYSNAEENDWYRYQVLNNPEDKGNWTWLASPEVNYGKFSNGSYPYQLWEPDSMQDIRDYIGIYLGGARHAPGYHFAINIDMAMFRVYSSRAEASASADKQLAAGKDLPGCESTLSISQPLLSSTTSSTVEDANPLLVELPGSGEFLAVAVRAHKDIVFSSVRANRAEYQASTTGTVTLPAEASAWLLSNSDATLVSAVVFRSEGAASSVLLLNSVGRVLVVTLTGAGELTVTSTAQGTLPDTLLGTAYDIIALAQGDAECATGASCWLVATAQGTEVTVASVQLSADASTGVLSSKVVTSVVVPVPTSSTVDSAKLAVLDETVGASPVLFVSQGLNIYAAEVSLSTSFSSSVAPLWSAVTTGKHLQLSVAGAGADRALMLVTDYGYCYNSHAHNTRAYPMVCASQPLPTQTVLDYSLGLAAHWLEALRSGDSALKKTPVTGAVDSESLTYLATSCSQKILHGSYDQGARPAIALSKQAAPTSVASRDDKSAGVSSELYFFLEAHEGLPVASAGTLGSRGGGECGEPVHVDGIVLDAFEIDSWVRSLQRVYL